MSFTMPYGYGSSRVTEEQLRNKATFNRLHPEVQERFLAMSKFLASIGVPLGVGTGWRVQPANKPGFASPGNSWHEGVPVSSQANALAIDAVPASSFDAMEMHCHKFGFRTFRHVNNEPWHIQPTEIPASRRWATTLPHLEIHHKPGAHDLTDQDFVQSSTPSPSLKQGDSGHRVAQLQNIIKFWKWGDIGNVDGNYGPRTLAAVKIMQAVLKVVVDGNYGPQTRAALVKFLEYMGSQSAEHETVPPTASAPNTTPSTPTPTLKEGSTGNQVKALQNALNFWKWGNCGNADGKFGPRTKAAVKIMQGKIGATPDGVYGPKTRDHYATFLTAMANLNK